MVGNRSTCVYFNSVSSNRNKALNEFRLKAFLKLIYIDKTNSDSKLLVS